MVIGIISLKATSIWFFLVSWRPQVAAIFGPFLANLRFSGALQVMAILSIALLRQT